MNEEKQMFLFVRNIKYRPSTFYRIAQYLDKIEGKIIITEYEHDLYYEKSVKKYKEKIEKSIIYSLLVGYFRRINTLLKILILSKNYTIYVQREIFPKIIGPIGMLLTYLIIRKAEYIFWDFDDNIFEANEITKFERKLLIKFSDKIIVGNEYLKKILNLQDYSKVKVINTTDIMMDDIDIESISKLRVDSFDKAIILIWVGTKSNIKFLKNILHEIEEFSKKVKQPVILKVVSDASIEYKSQFFCIENIKWTREVALVEMKKAHVGLMPLEESSITKGKCAFKAVQYIGCGLPVVVSNVGMNKEVVTNNNGLAVNKGKFTDGLYEICKNKSVWINYSKGSRELWKSRFNPAEVVNELNKILKYN